MLHPIALAALSAAAIGFPDPPLWRPAGALPMMWRTERHATAATGEKTCLVISLGGNVTVVFTKPEPSDALRTSVRIGFRNQPGSLRYLRINRQIFQTAEDSFAGDEAREIVTRLKGPGEFAFEWALKPDHTKQQGLFGTGDFTAKSEACLTWLGGRRT